MCVSGRCVAPPDGGADGGCPGRLCLAGALSTPDPLRAVWGSGGASVFAVGADGGVYHWDGGAWAFLPGSPTADLVDVWGNSDDDVWVASRSAVVHLGGGWQTWQVFPYSSGSTLPDVVVGIFSGVPNEARMVATSNGGTAFFHCYSGSCISTLSDSRIAPRAMGGPPGQDGYWTVGMDRSAGSGALIRHPASGVIDAYQALGQGPLNGIASDSAGAMMAVGAGGTVAVAAAGAASFTLEPSGPAVDLEQVAFVPGGGRAYAVAGNQILYRRAAPSTWEAFTPAGAAGAALHDVFAASGGVLVVVGELDGGGIALVYSGAQ
ncbi:MAG TPA: hypothetical protein VND93_08570 [Myxococcales bacterium]|nr:hypothetical protein [Myxococcales bacterium]